MLSLCTSSRVSLPHYTRSAVHRMPQLMGRFPQRVRDSTQPVHSADRTIRRAACRHETRADVRTAQPVAYTCGPACRSLSSRAAVRAAPEAHIVIVIAAAVLDKRRTTSFPTE